MGQHRPLRQSAPGVTRRGLRGSDGSGGDSGGLRGTRGPRRRRPPLVRQRGLRGRQRPGVLVQTAHLQGESALVRAGPERRAGGVLLLAERELGAGGGVGEGAGPGLERPAPERQRTLCWRAGEGGAVSEELRQRRRGGDGAVAHALRHLEPPHHPGRRQQARRRRRRVPLQGRAEGHGDGLLQRADRRTLAVGRRVEEPVVEERRRRRGQGARPRRHVDLLNHLAVVLHDLLDHLVLLVVQRPRVQVALDVVHQDGVLLACGDTEGQ